MAAANVLQYVLQLAASHALSPDDFGAFGSLLALGVVGAVPMLALQTVVASRVAHTADDVDAQDAEVGLLLASALRIAVVVTLVALLVAPVVSLFLRGPLLAAVWLALSFGPLAIAGTAQGVLQGRERFAALAGLFLGVSGLRVAGGILALVARPNVTSAMAGTALGALLAGILGLVAMRHRVRGPAAPTPTRVLTELRHAASGVLALLILGGADLLLARHLLSGSESGRYAAASLVARGCFWAPQFVAVLVLPHLASGRTAMARHATAFVCVLGVLEVLAGLLVPRSVIGLVLGPAYTSLAHVLALFAATGAALAVLQLMLYAGIARGGSVVGQVVWAAIAVEVGVVLTFGPALVGLVSIALACTALAALVSALLIFQQDAAPGGTDVTSLPLPSSVS